MQTWIHLKKESSASLALSSWCVYQPIEARHGDDDPLILCRLRDDVHVNCSQPNNFVWFEQKSWGYEYILPEEANWSGSALFAIKYVNLYQQSGLNNLIGWKLEKGVAS